MSDLLKTICVNDFKALSQCDENIIVIDVRSAAEANNEYFEGSINLPLHEMGTLTFQECMVCNGHNNKGTVYLLCGSGQRAQKAAQQLRNTVSNPLVVIEGGINAMKQCGITLKKGSSAVISLERQVRIAAGSLVVLGVILGAFLNTAFYGLSAFVGAGLIFAGITDTCGMGLILARMPWNRVG